MTTWCCVLEARGLRVPEDVSVVGFDDYLPAAGAPQPVTTWTVDTVEMARLAVKTLLRRIQGEAGYPIQTVTCDHLVLRQTVRDLTK